MWGSVLAIFAVVGMCAAQQTATKPSPQSNSDSQINVNWIYGSYVPKDVPLQSLTNSERWKLYVRQTYTTPGIYVKTAIVSLRDQIQDSPEEWGSGAGAYVKRFGSRQAQFVIQNSLSAAGNAALGWEPRYDRCKCDGLWPRTRHAILRNFVTYDRTEKSLRPQLMPYAAAFGGGVIAGSWSPGNPNLLVKGYQGAITQAGVGIGVNWLSEFAPEIMRKLRPRKKDTNAKKDNAD